MNDLDLIHRARREAEVREVLEAYDADRAERDRPNFMADGELTKMRRRQAIANKPERAFPDYPDRAAR